MCCQLGAREHYSVPRALRLRNELGLLVTDVWTAGRRSAGMFLGSAASDRFHPDLHGSAVVAFNSAYAFSELNRRLRYQGWDRLLARNEWFQGAALKALRAYQRRNSRERTTLFAYSYAARRLFEFARSVGWKTVLGQIDGGPAEERIEIALRREHSAFSRAWLPAPPEYWECWNAECSLADAIVVNSRWSYDCLATGGVATGKMKTIPLAYEPPPAASGFQRPFPKSFTAQRPLRILFLGQINVRKGVTAIFDALDGLEGQPVEFRMVGPLQMDLPSRLSNHPLLSWVGPVARGNVAAEYMDADVFLLPTFSDGFGITQLEAQAWKMPVIASAFCGEVVRHLDNGYLLPGVSGPEIVRAVRWFLTDAKRVAILSRNSALPCSSNLKSLGTRLSALFQHPAPLV